MTFHAASSWLRKKHSSADAVSVGGDEIKVAGYFLLPHERRWIRRHPPKLRSQATTTPSQLLRQAGEADLRAARNLCLITMMIAFSMAAITRANGGPIDRGSTLPAWQIPFIAAFWLLIASILATLALGVVRRVQASRAF